MKRLIFIPFFIILYLILYLYFGPSPFLNYELNQNIEKLPRGRVIFISLDGIRSKDLKKIWTRILKINTNELFEFGLNSESEKMIISNNSYRSSSGYQSIFSGHYIRNCLSNDCGLIKKKTIIDQLIDRHYFKNNEIAVFASWENIAYAIESTPRVVKSIGFEPIQNMDLNSYSNLSASLTEFNALSSVSRPIWLNSRKDVYTWLLAKEFEKTVKPKFLYISLVDSDEYAHLNDIKNYEKTLTRYEDDILQWINELNQEINNEDISFVITTDHGRGDLVFKWHGFWTPAAANIWTIVIPSKKLKIKNYVNEKTQFTDKLK